MTRSGRSAGTAAETGAPIENRSRSTGPRPASSMTAITCAAGPSTVSWPPSSTVRSAPERPGVMTVREEARRGAVRPRLTTAAGAAEAHAYYSRLHVADPRAAYGRRGGDPASTRLVERLRAAGEEFASLWAEHEVAVRRHSRMRVEHPLIGPVDLDRQVLLAPEGEQRLVFYAPPPGTATADRLALLTVVGTDQFTP